MNYLLTPNKATRTMFKAEFETMEQDNILKIGIQVRFGDDTLLHTHEHLSDEAKFEDVDKFLRVRSLAAW